MVIADLTTVLLLAAVIPYILILAFALRAILRGQGLRDWASALLLLYLLLSFFWTLGQLILHLDLPTPLGDLPGGDQLLARLLGYAVLLLALLFLSLTRQFLQLEAVDGRWLALGLAWLAATVVLGEGLLPLADPLWRGERLALGPRDLAFGALVLGWAALMGSATVLTVRVYRSSPQPLHRNRITYWSLALVPTAAGLALFLGGSYSPIASLLAGLGCLLHLLGAGCTVYLMLTYRLPDVRRTSRRALAYLIVTLLAAGIYAACLLGAQYALQSLPGYDPWLVAAALALLLAVLVPPLLDLVRKTLDRLLSGRRYDPSHTLREYSASISNILDLERLATVAVDLIGEALDVRRGDLFVVHWTAGGFQLRAPAGGAAATHAAAPGNPAGALAPGSPIADCLRRERHPLTQYDIDLLPRFRKTPPGERAWLKGLGMDVYVPVYAKNDWIGLLALGPKSSGDRYFDRDLDLLSTLADQTAVALENARLFEDLKAHNAENERLNRALKSANLELRHMDKAKSDFIQIASHELRTPLTNIRGYNDLLNTLLDQGLLSTDNGQQMIQGIRASTQRLEEIARTMLEVSRIETETLKLNLWPTKLEATVEAAAARWRGALAERCQELSTRGFSELPTILADGERLEQVFSELIQNAIKFTPDGGRIQVRARAPDLDSPVREQKVEIVVADTGIGIAPDNLERVFAKFYRVGDVMLHSTGRTKFKGAGPGLGLTIARGIVEAHGGTLWAESPGCDEKGCPGTEFHLRLPLEPPCRPPDPDDTVV